MPSLEIKRLREAAAATAELLARNPLRESDDDELDIQVEEARGARDDERGS